MQTKQAFTEPCLNLWLSWFLINRSRKDAEQTGVHRRFDKLCSPNCFLIIHTLPTISLATARGHRPAIAHQDLAALRSAGRVAASIKLVGFGMYIYIYLMLTASRSHPDSSQTTFPASLPLHLPVPLPLTSLKPRARSPTRDSN